MIYDTGTDAPMVLDRVPGWVTVLLLVAVAALALIACDSPMVWRYL